jgi:uncharacterized protein involved in propanediol utilization
MLDQRPSTDLYRGTAPIGRGKSFGTFGELLQGRLAEDERDFLVTFPIERFAHATFISDPTTPSVTVTPAGKSKSRLLAAMMLEYLELPTGGRLLIESSLPIGKGLASSSADLVATARAVASCFDRQVSPSTVEFLMRAIEPSDGVMYHGIVSFYHREVRLREWLGMLPPLAIVAVDEGGELDTLHFNTLNKPFTAADKREYRRLLARMAAAIRQGDLATVGEVATRSAVLNQKLNPKTTLGDVRAICQQIRGLGVVAAHSGTCLGLLLSPHDPRYRHQLDAACRRLGRLTDDLSIYQSMPLK